MEHVEKLDILAFGAHPDDVEIGMAGAIVVFKQQGYKVGICDLTKAELSSNGTVEIRQAEAQKAASVLSLDLRINLQLPDRGLLVEKKAVDLIVNTIRRYKPSIVFAPYFEDRHPDHGHCGKLVEEALFSSGVHNYKTHEQHEAHRAKDFYYYFINGFHKPDFLIDITSTMDVKIASLQAYESQFIKTEGSVDTPLTNGYIDTVISRERMYGKEVNVQYAEGFKAKKPLLINNLLGD
ncbi:bacillithiol biosynthesis deacetylase BshB1 [Bacillus taeanensis]|uniref:Bacillithiol biosynthesis deacetylase BshB1 n=1 Tax=Bacillus taeanensis TaxID=273032 RepID=A0A366XWH8_9BACI|nr:bacillithiol biosynthesis deacetylase BshB1 [Bacillus taeanensis]RBW70257.1 bacillithiol biosynthesis deacetylase BshB1 [Bacillus taeanensis]